LLLLHHLDSSSARSGNGAGVASSPVTSGKVKTVDGGHKMMVAGQLLPSTLLSRSATEFDLVCETDAVYRTAAQRDRPVDKTVSSAADLMSGGSVTASSSVDTVDDEAGVDGGADVTDIGSVLNTSAVSGMKVCTENDVPRFKYRRNNDKKASRIVYI